MTKNLGMQRETKTIWLFWSFGCLVLCIVLFVTVVDVDLMHCSGRSVENGVEKLSVDRR